MRFQELGYEIRQGRLARGMTQAALAEAAGISRTTLNQLENGLSPDLGVRKVQAILDKLGLELAIQPAKPKVRPDFVFPKLRLALFVDGCFWHACPRHATKPRNNAAFWRKKLAANQARDRLVTRALRQRGWRVLRIWEHELARKQAPHLLRKLVRFLNPAWPNLELREQGSGMS